jgi:hydroxymethylglutaryl-CoA reductase
MTRSSRLPGFYNKSLEERAQIVAEWAGLDSREVEALRGEMGLDTEQADHMIENVVGVHGLPLGIALNFVVNGRDVLVPMAIEEPSVVAGASFMAKLAREGGGFQVSSTEPEMIGQMQVLDLDDPGAAREQLLGEKARLLELADGTDPVIVNLGGGARDLEARVLDSPLGQMLIVHLIYDTRDAMGANTINTACEALAPVIEDITGGRVHLRILSNLADRRLASARCRILVSSLAFDDYAGEDVARGIMEAWAFAAADPYRAATHNKGIMNGVDAVAIATGNDWRAIEAGAHAYAARDGRYTSLSTWEIDGEGHLAGHLEMPMAVGMVGGATRVHPAAQVALKLLSVESASDLAEIIVAVGLAQNLAALRALATEGIQKGHMALHARQLAIAAGATGQQIELVVSRMLEEGAARLDRAEAIVKELGGA